MISPFRLLRRRRRRKLLQRGLISESTWLWSLAGLRIFDLLNNEERERLRQLSTLFVHEKIFEPAGGMILDDRVRTRIAALACLPILNLDFDCYDGWRTVVVYPGGFIRPRSEFDAIGVMHEWEDVLTGESWERGPVILSWADVQGSGHCEGYNVVIHEMAHKLDMLNGAADGFPNLHRGMARRVWTDAFTAAFEDFNDRVDQEEKTPIDPYAAEAPGEFFAVLSEYFFEAPDLVRMEYPEIYDLLAQFYRQDPAARFRSSLPADPFQTRDAQAPRESRQTGHNPLREALADAVSGDDHGRFEND
ncbi:MULTISPECIES: M90 family metallopeptidase [Methylocaldum]|jgi:Mlc titration factor MtfA (ptsG expression regulator)|uniref:M90 family metallopeptidase n=1 Tax=unclassified Methylocaldum TaxID=2622260 RepID=UPI00098AF091|nr:MULTISPECIES: M90 family metallopeptidase [unclassified Methylocaldum]MBP1149775.1 Mlc titration factor MtfA (ptsG expression regulator) [Methylocaldum sp. RMAD-M]MDV3243214.1 zinc-dependent peptidase [Methylocaldum sp.]MVF20470.1 zinc-dependent peptidase [Methylocaldum sp. BRCS4]